MDGPEVAPSTCLEVSSRLHENKYYVHGGASGDTGFDHVDRSSLPQAGSRAKFRPTRTVVGIGVICLAAALGTGLGAGVAIRSSSRSSSGAKTLTTATITIMQTRNASDITACSTTLESYTPTPTPLPTQASDITACSTTPESYTPTPIPLPTQICPAGNGSTYVATNTIANNPAPSAPWQQTRKSSFSFEILCNVDFVDTFRIGGPFRDMQIITNVSTLTDCLDECALYNFRTPEEYFPAWACTGVSWGEGLPQEFSAPYCWLKANVTLGSDGPEDGKLDGAVLLNV